MHPMLNIAIRAARMAGNLIIKHYETYGTISKNIKKNNINVIDINQEAERLIIEVINKYYPQNTIISNNKDLLPKKNNDIQWIIDPLDGLINFIKRFPHFTVSIAVRIKGCMEVAVVYDPICNELFTASRGQGTQLNGYRLRGSKAHNLDGTILAAGFPFQQKQHTNNYTNLLRKLFIKCADFRRTGSISLDLAYVAAGRVDGFCEIGLKPWNCASGELLVREAGGLVTDFTGNYNNLLSGNIVAGNSRVVQAILSIISEELKKCEVLNVNR